MSRRPLPLIASFLVVAFAAQEIVWAAPALEPRHASSRAPLAAVVSDPSRLSVPLDRVAVRAAHRGTNGRLIVHLQDAHSNLSAQKNIAAAIDAIAAEHSIHAVLAEGGWNEATLTGVREKLGAEDAKRAAERLLFDGMISGHEYLNLTSERPFRILGVEDESLYGKNLASYAELAERRGAGLEELRGARKALERLKGRIYPAELIELEAAKGGNGVEWTKALAAAAKKRGIAVRGELARVAELEAAESRIDFEAANSEQLRIIQDLPAESRTRAVEHLKRSQRDRTGGAQSKLAFVRALFAEAEAAGRASSLVEMRKYREYLEGFASLDFLKLLSEAAGLEKQVYEAALAGGDAKLLRAADRHVTLLENAFGIKLDSAGFAELRADAREFDAEAWQAFLNRKLAELSYFEDWVRIDAAIDGTRGAFERFYEAANRRDEAFVANAERIFAEQGIDAAFLVAGGYHTSHLTELLREKGYSYVVLAPVVADETDHAEYEKNLLAPVEKAEREAARLARAAGAGANPQALSMTLAREAQSRARFSAKYGAAAPAPVAAFLDSLDSLPQAAVMKPASGSRAMGLRTVRVGAGDGELSEYWFRLEEVDRAMLRNLLEEGQESFAGRRSTVRALSKPIVDGELRITEVQIKGFYVNELEPTAPHTGAGYAQFGLFGPAGESPEGGMLAETARHEYETTLKLYDTLRHSGAYVKMPLAWGTFPHVRFKGRALGFVVLGVPDFMTDRAASLNLDDAAAQRYAAAAGSALAQMHRAGYGHGFMHMGNVSWAERRRARTLWLRSESMTGIHDLETAFPLDLAHIHPYDPAMTLEQAMFLDCDYALSKMRHLSDFAPARGGAPSLPMLLEWQKPVIAAFFRGYFSFLPAKERDEAAELAAQRHYDFQLSIEKQQNQHALKTGRMKPYVTELFPRRKLYFDFLWETGPARDIDLAPFRTNFPKGARTAGSMLQAAWSRAAAWLRGLRPEREPAAAVPPAGTAKKIRFASGFEATLEQLETWTREAAAEAGAQAAITGGLRYLAGEDRVPKDVDFVVVPDSGEGAALATSRFVSAFGRRVAPGVEPPTRYIGQLGDFDIRGENGKTVLRLSLFPFNSWEDAADELALMLDYVAKKIKDPAPQLLADREKLRKDLRMLAYFFGEPGDSAVIEKVFAESPAVWLILTDPRIAAMVRRFSMTLELDLINGGTLPGRIAEKLKSPIGFKTAGARALGEQDTIAYYGAVADKIQASPVLETGNFALTVHRGILDGMLEYEQLLEELDRFTEGAFAPKFRDAMLALRKKLAGGPAGLWEREAFVPGDEEAAQTAVLALREDLADFQHDFSDVSIFTNALTDIQLRPHLLRDARVQETLSSVSRTRRRVWRLYEHFFKITDTADPKPAGIVSREFDLNEALKEAVRLESNRHPLYFRNADIQVKAGNIPKIAVDETRFMNAVREIIRNAAFSTVRKIGGWEYRPFRSTSQVTITTRLGEAGRVEIAVADNGIGMTPPEIEDMKLFAFSRSKYEQDVFFGGRGIGFPTAVQTFEEHGGAIRVESDLATGTVVTMTLPAPAGVREAAGARTTLNPSETAYFNVSAQPDRMLEIDIGRVTVWIRATARDEFELTFGPRTAPFGGTDEKNAYVDPDDPLTIKADSAFLLKRKKTGDRQTLNVEIRNSGGKVLNSVDYSFTDPDLAGVTDEPVRLAWSPDPKFRHRLEVLNHADRGVRTTVYAAPIAGQGSAGLSPRVVSRAPLPVEFGAYFKRRVDEAIFRIHSEVPNARFDQIAAALRLMNETMSSTHQMQVLADIGKFRTFLLANNGDTWIRSETIEKAADNRNALEALIEIAQVSRQVDADWHATVAYLSGITSVTAGSRAFGADKVIGSRWSAPLRTIDGASSDAFLALVARAAGEGRIPDGEYAVDVTSLGGTARLAASGKTLRIWNPAVRAFEDLAVDAAVMEKTRTAHLDTAETSSSASRFDASWAPNDSIQIIAETPRASGARSADVEKAVAELMADPRLGLRSAVSYDKPSLDLALGAAYETLTQVGMGHAEAVEALASTLGSEFHEADEEKIAQLVTKALLSVTFAHRALAMPLKNGSLRARLADTGLYYRYYHLLYYGEAFRLAASLGQNELPLSVTDRVDGRVRRRLAAHALFAKDHDTAEDIIRRTLFESPDAYLRVMPFEAMRLYAAAKEALDVDWADPTVAGYRRQLSSNETADFLLGAVFDEDAGEDAAAQRPLVARVAMGVAIDELVAELRGLDRFATLDFESDEEKGDALYAALRDVHLSIERVKMMMRGGFSDAFGLDDRDTARFNASLALADMTAEELVEEAMIIGNPQNAPERRRYVAMRYVRLGVVAKFLRDGLPLTPHVGKREAKMLADAFGRLAEFEAKSELPETGRLVAAMRDFDGVLAAIIVDMRQKLKSSEPGTRSRAERTLVLEAARRALRETDRAQAYRPPQGSRADVADSFADREALREARQLFNVFEGKRLGDVVVRLDDLAADRSKGPEDEMLRANLVALQALRAGALLHRGEIYVEGSPELVRVASSLGFDEYDSVKTGGAIVVATAATIRERGLKPGEGAFVIHPQESGAQRRLLHEIFLALGLSALQGPDDKLDDRLIGLVAREKGIFERSEYGKIADVLTRLGRADFTKTSLPDTLAEAEKTVMLPLGARLPIDEILRRAFRLAAEIATWA